MEKKNGFVLAPGRDIDIPQTEMSSVDLQIRLVDLKETYGKLSTKGDLLDGKIMHSLSRLIDEC